MVGDRLMDFDNSQAIGVFDSGVGGISVLAQLIFTLPGERYIYYGDSLNAPYGLKSTEEVRELSFNVVEKLLKKRIKALVVACNTATSGAIKDLKTNLKMPVVGMEPALKPAIELNKAGKILVMATPVTLNGKKFNDLIETYHPTSEVVKLPCRGLVEIIEKTGGKGKEIEEYLDQLFAPFNENEVASIVLGCTHFAFIKEEIMRIVGNKVAIIDGNKGTARQLERLLQKHNLLNQEEHKTTEVLIINSSKDNEIINLKKSLLEEGLKKLGWMGNIKYI